MKTRVIQDEQSTVPPAPLAEPERSGSPPAPRPGEPRSRSPLRLLALFAGGLAVALALALLAGAAALAVGLGARDADGYFSTGAHPLATSSHALVTEHLDVGTDVPELAPGEPIATSRIEVGGARPVFVGIGPRAEVERYLARVEHTVITDVDTNPFRVRSRLVDGPDGPDAPATQGFWRAQASGPGTQAITWPLEEGEFAAVIMNADGSRDVAVDARFGARAPWLRWVAIGLLVAGLLALAVGAALLYRGVQRRRSA